MSYRTIEVAGNKHEYTIGRTFVKFRGGDPVPLEKIGIKVGPKKYVVKPDTIRQYLENGTVSQQGKCRCGQKGDLCCDPYDAEIHNKKNFRFFCDDCYEACADDI